MYRLSRLVTGLIVVCCHTVALQFHLVGHSPTKPSANSQLRAYNSDAKWIPDDDLRESTNVGLINRRAMVAFMAAFPTTVLSTSNQAFAAEKGNPRNTLPIAESITVPLQFNGKELLVLYRVDGSLFRAVLDTGSPFLMIPGACGENTRAKSGCFRNQGVPSGLASTYEIFDGFEGDVQWRMAPFSFENATGSLIGPPLITFGVVSESIMSGPGAVFFGLVKDTEPDIRPSFLGQTSITSFQIDLLSSDDDDNSKALTLSTAQMIFRQ